jgi:hypothetical protein
MPPVTDGITDLELYVTGFGTYQRRGPAWYAPAPDALEIDLVDGDDAWDRQIAKDAAKGKLDWLRQEAIDALRSGTVDDL